MKISPLLPALFLSLFWSGFPAFSQTAAVPKNDDPFVEVKLPNSQIQDVLSIYEIYTGKRLIRDSNLAANNAPMTIISAKPLPKSEAIRFIEAALLLNGYTISPGPDGALKVINTSSGKTPRSEGIALYANAADLPPGDQLVSFYLPLRYIPSNQALTAFTAQATPHPYGAYVEIPHTQALVLTENTSVIRQLLALKDLIDVPPVQVVSEFVKLQRADADRVSDAINKLLDTAKKSQGAPSPGTLMPASATPQLESQLVAGDVQIVPDSRTNRILLVTRPINLPFLKSLIEQFDQSSNVVAPLQRTLRYITAGEVLTIIQDVLTDSKDDPGKAAGNAANANQNRPNNANQNRSTSATSSGSTASASTLSGQLGDAPDTTPLSIIVGKTKVIADLKTNSILVIGPPESLEKVNALLDQMDRKPRQVYIATVVGKLNMTNNTELSVDLLQNFAHINGDFGVATSSLNSSGLGTKLDPTTLSTAGVFPAISGANLYGAVGKTLNYYVKALQNSGRFTVLSRPSIYTANNKKATISSGQQVPVPQSSLSQLDSTGTTTASVSSTIQYQRVDLLLEVIPLINDKKEINLQISQQNNNINGNTTISGNSIPIIATDSLQTTVTVPNNATLVLGGLIRDTSSSTRSGFPFLSDLPLVGALFRSDTKNKQREELVILIEPQVIETEEELAAIQEAEKKRQLLGDEAIDYQKKTTPSINTKGKVP